jgi:sugar phosphate isomerase/epimerase
MVYGKKLLENAKRLADLVDNIEIVLFNTPNLNNTPDSDELDLLRKLGRKKKVTFTVHLPASLEIASKDRKLREQSIRMVSGLCNHTAPLEPLHYILHVPYTTPSLVPVPGLYFKTDDGRNWAEWTRRGLGALERIFNTTPMAGKLLLENINYSPYFLEPFLKEGQCGLCLDTGHLILGRENVNDALRRYQEEIRELHIHGVKGYEDHLSLSVLPVESVCEWMDYLIRIEFDGILNLEVFSSEDLAGSLNTVTNAIAATPGVF